jgi:hypothetical protein
MKAKPLRIMTEQQALAMLPEIPKGTNERELPLAMRGGLLGVYGFGPNPAREHLEKTDEQR